MQPTGLEEKQPKEDPEAGDAEVLENSTNDSHTHYVPDSGKMKRGKMWSQPSKDSQSYQRNIWRCDFIPCGVDFRGSSKRPITANENEVTV